MDARADFELHEESGKSVLRFTGALTLAALGDLPKRLNAVHATIDTLDVAPVTRIDTVGAFLLHELSIARGATITGMDPDQRHLFEKVVAAADVPVERPKPPYGIVLRVFDETGSAVLTALNTLYGLLGFLGATLIGFWSVLTHPRRFRVNAVVERLEVVGVTALGIVGLMSFLIGIVIAQQGSVQLRQFGAEIYTIDLLGRITLRELGILMTAIMIAGRSGSAFAAQLGTMKLTEEIDAMRVIGVSPVEALVVPRTLASVVMMPLLGFYSSVVALIGGGLLVWISLDIPPYTYVQRLGDVVPLTDLWIGLIKAPVFGLIIAVCGCFQGMQVEGDAEQVGRRTTAAVVQAIFLVIVLDAFFAVFFTEIGW